MSALRENGIQVAADVLDSDDIVRTIDLTEFELFVLHNLVREDINESFLLCAEGRVPTYTPEAMARLNKLVEKLS